MNLKAVPTLLLVMIALAGQAQTTQYRSAPNLGEASHAPTNLVLNPPPAKGGQPQIQTVTGGFSVDTDAREEVRSFYNAIYPTSENIPQDTTGDASSCTP
ncbi:MAG: hypothetical protein ABSF34_16430, partial [Verrucomicrobiota bacterium]